ncbi:MAG: hypothetical protein J7K72_00675 [Candidatus Aenigmarchaeota archaeon]|nr:hypothetical protein [Candidatus Aenigmarchaeota archaeon]
MPSHEPEIIEIRDKNHAKEEIMKIGASGVDIMVPKAVFKVVKIRHVRSPAANIIKQEMLSIGGEAAVNRGCVSCSVPETDILLMGTIRHYQLLIEKMKKQVSDCREIADELEEVLEEWL